MHVPESMVHWSPSSEDRGLGPYLYRTKQLLNTLLSTHYTVYSIHNMLTIESDKQIEMSLDSAAQMLGNCNFPVPSSQVLNLIKQRSFRLISPAMTKSRDNIPYFVCASIAAGLRCPGSCPHSHSSCTSFCTCFLTRR